MLTNRIPAPVAVLPWPLALLFAAFAALAAACGSSPAAINHPPVGRIEAPAASTVTIAPGESVTFTGSCLDPDGGALTHAWSFGGGAAASTKESPGAVTFATAGTFTVVYTCTDAAGLADTVPPTRTVKVVPVAANNPPVASITAPAGNTSITAGDSVSFSGACADPDPSDTSFTYEWLFGGAGPKSTVASPGSIAFPNAGTFTVSFTCTDPHGLGDTTPDTRVITVNPAVANQAPDSTISAPAADATIAAGASVTFTGGCSDPDAADTTFTFAWSFGGGAAASTQQSPGAVTFANAGTYAATFTCTDAHGLADPTPATRTVTVTAAAGNQAPESLISAPVADTTIAPGGSVTFTGGCTDPDAADTVFTYAWSFGTGAATSTQQSPGAVTFANAGTYPVTFTCTDSHGLADPTPATLTVTVASGGVYTLTGTVTFEKVPSTAYSSTTGATQGLDYAHAVKRPIRNADLSIVEAANLNNVLASGVTGSDGAWSLSWAKTGPSAVKVIVYSRTHSPKMIVEDNTAGNAVYALSSSNVDANTITKVDLNAAHGWDGTKYATRAASPFAVLDSVWQAVQTFLTVRPAAAFPDLHANWSAKNAPIGPQGSETDAQAIAAGHIGTSFWDGEELYLLGQVDVDTDEFDDHVVVHEWGHYFESKFSRSDSPGGSHGFGDLKDPTLAWSEGWGNGLSGIVWSPVSAYTDSSGKKQASGFGLDVEDNSAGEDPTPGWFSEATVQAVLYDIFDSGTGEAFDKVALGLGPIYDAQVGPQKTTTALTTLFSFLSGLKAANPSAAASIDTLTANRGALGVPVADAYGTGETNNGGSSVNLPVYRPITTSASVTVTMTGDAVNGNELGQNRFLRFVGDGASHKVFIDTGKPAFDADVYVVKNGELLVLANGSSGTESTDPFPTTAGTEYIILVNGLGDGSASTPNYDVLVKVE